MKTESDRCILSQYFGNALRPQLDLAQQSYRDPIAKVKQGQFKVTEHFFTITYASTLKFFVTFLHMCFMVFT